MDSESDYADDASGTAAFHQAWDFNMRVSRLQWLSDEYQVQNNISKWFDILEVLYKEIRHQMTKMKKKNLKEFINDQETTRKELIVLRNQFLSAYDNYRNMKKNYPELSELYFNPPNDLRERCFQWELILKDVLDKRGLLMPSKGDARFAT